MTRNSTTGEIATRLLRKRIRTHSISAVSVGVFDTVLMRAVGDPTTVYRCVATALRTRHAVDISRDAFASERAAAALRASFNQQGRAVPLYDIYSELCFSLGVPNLVDVMVALELEVERDLVVPVPGAIGIVATAREMTGAITFISDSPLPVSFLKNQLTHFGFLTDADRLIVAHNASSLPTSGNPLAAALHGCHGDPSTWLHIGSHHTRDTLWARSLGMRSFHYPAASVPPSEQELLDLSDDLIDTASFLAGSARLTSLRAPEALSEDQRTAWDTGATVTGPLIYAMARRLLERARQKKITRLLFLARDGLLPFIAVQRMLEQEGGQDIGVAYAYGSRATYYPLMCQRLGPREWDDLTSFFGASYKTLGEVCEALGIDHTTLQSHLLRLTGTAIPADSPLPSTTLATIKRHAIDDPELNAVIGAGIGHLQRATLQHLRQLGLRSGENIGLVDAGWSGRAHGPLYEFLRSQNASSVTMFYFGHPVVGSFEPVFAPGDVETLLFNEHTPAGYCNFYFTPSLSIADVLDVSYPQAVEMLCHANHGRTVSFTLRDDEAAPVLRANENEAFAKAFFHIYRSAVLAFIADIHPRRDLLPKVDNLSLVAQRICERFWLRPTQAEVALWRRWVWSNDPHDREVLPIVTPYRLRDALPVIVNGRLPHLHPQFWTHAALIISPKPVQLILGMLLATRARILSVMPSRVLRLLGTARTLIAGLWQQLRRPA